MLSVENQPAFLGNISQSAYYLLHASVLLGLFLDLEDGDSMFLQNSGYVPGDRTLPYVI
jgi:hypothetical protein